MHCTNTNEILSYPPDARLLILNADDFGVYHAVTEGILRTVLDGVASSTTVMVPCPWGRYALRLLAEHPDITYGVHLTLQAEYPDYRWGPITVRDRVSTLVDETSYFHRNEPNPAYVAGFALEDVEIEFRAQIESVLDLGLKPTHLDWHCLADGGRPDIFDLTVCLAKEYGLALRVHDGNRAERLQRSGLPANNHEVVDSTRLETEGKTARFVQMLRELPAGLTEWAVHPALDTVEARAIDAWWCKRVADLEFLTSQEARDTISSEGIVLLDYRPLQSVWD